MFRMAADENFNNDILRGLKHRTSDVDIVRIQDTDVAGHDDAELLEWAANENRILLTHDFQTMIGFARQRIEAGQPMPGLFVMRNPSQPGTLIDELWIIIEISQQNEWGQQVTFLPL